MLTTNLKAFFNIWVNAMKQYAFLKKLSPRLPDLQVIFRLKNFATLFKLFWQFIEMTLNCEMSVLLYRTKTFHLGWISFSEVVKTCGTSIKHKQALLVVIITNSILVFHCQFNRSITRKESPSHGLNYSIVNYLLKTSLHK